MVAARVVFLFTALGVAASLTHQLVDVIIGASGANSGGEPTLLPVEVRVFRMFSFFTVQSNLLVLAATATLALRPDRDGRLWRVLRLDALLGISITGLVYWLVLAPLQPSAAVYTPTNLSLHLVSPVLAVLGWLVFGPRPRIGWSTVGWAFVWPVAWIVCTFVRGGITGWYPYPFLDVTTVGYPQALAGSGAVVVLGLVLALMFRLLDRLPTRSSPSARP